MKEYTREQVIHLIDNMLQHADAVMDAINNEYTDWFGEELLELSESTIDHYYKTNKINV